MQSSNVIVRATNVILYTFRLFSVLLAVHSHHVHLRSQSNEFGHYRTIIFVLHQAEYFFARGIPYTLSAG